MRLLPQESASATVPYRPTVHGWITSIDLYTEAHAVSLQASLFDVRQYAGVPPM